jgi:uncharacterized membrane protein YfcA
MEDDSFFSKYRFTIVLFIVIAAAAALVVAFGPRAPEGSPSLSLPLIALMATVGFAAGLLGGWIGTGGCSVMLPVLHFWLGFPAPIAVGTTLFAVIFTAISGGYGHFRKKNVDKRVALWLGGSGIVGVAVGSLLFTLFSDQSTLLGLIIGIVFLWPSIRMIFEGFSGYGKKAAAAPAAPPEQAIRGGKPLSLSAFGSVVGTLTGLVGLGGGYALVPGLIYLFKAPVYITMGTSLAVMVPMALVGGSIKLVQGFVYPGAALVLAAGTIVGAQIGAATIKKFKPNTLKLVFGLYFLYVAVKFIGNYAGIQIW